MTTFTIGGGLTVNRLGFGAMRLTGKGVWGPPDDPDECIRVLQRAVDLGVNFIDTADSYGPYVSERLIRKALHPYPEGLVIATKAGLLRTGPDEWPVLGYPAYLRQECEMSLRRLRVDTIDLFQLHRIDDKFPAEDQIGELVALQQEGKIRHIGLSEVNVDQLEAARDCVRVSIHADHLGQRAPLFVSRAGDRQPAVGALTRKHPVREGVPARRRIACASPAPAIGGPVKDRTTGNEDSRFGLGGVDPLAVDVERGPEDRPPFPPVEPYDEGETARVGSHGGFSLKAAARHRVRCRIRGRKSRWLRSGRADRQYR